MISLWISLQVRLCLVSFAIGWKHGPNVEFIVKISHQNDGMVKDDNKILNNIKVVIVPTVE